MFAYKSRQKHCRNFYLGTCTRYAEPTLKNTEITNLLYKPTKKFIFKLQKSDYEIASIQDPPHSQGLAYKLSSLGSPCPVQYSTQQYASKQYTPVQLACYCPKHGTFQFGDTPSVMRLNDT